jgi:hypothetical protein
VWAYLELFIGTLSIVTLVIGLHSSTEAPISRVSLIMTGFVFPISLLGLMLTYFIACKIQILL